MTDSIESELGAGYDSVPAGGLTKRSLSAFKWNYLGSLSKVVSQLVIGIVLARVLGPEPFGLVAIAWLMLGLGNLIADFGLAAALIQKRQISERDVRHVFTLQMLAGVSLSVIAALASQWIGGFFGRSDAAPVLGWMGILFVIQAFGQTATSLLRRDLNHKRVQVLQVSSYLAAYLLLGVPLAVYGAGVWSLVTAQLTQAALYSLTTYLSVRHSLKPALRADQAGLFDFGSKVLASNLSSWGYLSIDSAIVGRLLGVVNLGLYNRGMNLVSSPTYAAVSTLQGVLFPLYSRLQGQTEKIRILYLASTCLLSTVLIPAFAGFASVPDTAIRAIYGEAWLPAAVLMTPLALAMPIYGILALGGPLMLGLGRAGMEASSQFLGLVFLTVIVTLAARSSLVAVGWAVLLSYSLRAILVSRLAMDLISVRTLELIRALAGPVMLGALALITAGLVDRVLAGSLTSFPMILASDIVLTALLVGIVFLLFAKWILCPEARSILMQLKHHLPRSMHRLVLHCCGTSANPQAVG